LFYFFVNDIQRRTYSHHWGCNACLIVEINKGIMMGLNNHRKRLAILVSAALMVIPHAVMAAPDAATQCKSGKGAACYSLSIKAKSPKDSAGWLKAGCKAKHARSCLTLALMYHSGKGLTKNSKKAAQNFKSACSLGELNSCTLLGSMHQDGYGTNKDPKIAASLFKRACKGQNQMGCAALAELLMKGEGVAKNRKKATSLAKRACKKGISRACKLLKAPVK
tara:strand:- start:109 stop:774 length:666 start_codon:yes stop_codon:yes gene_type:complete